MRHTLTPTCTSLLVHIYIGIHSTFIGRVSERDNAYWPPMTHDIVCRNVPGGPE